MTDQQKMVQQALIKLVDVAPYRSLDVITVLASEVDQRGRDSKYNTSAVRYPDKVVLTLVEPLTPKDYEDWAGEIVKAEELLGELEKERNHDTLNPNFFKAIMARLRYNRNHNQR